jgi:apolipoprotein N-acyltransferase
MPRVRVGPLGLGIVAGALLSFAFPGTGGQGWLAFGALAPLLVAVDKAPCWRASLLGGSPGSASG